MAAGAGGGVARGAIEKRLWVPEMAHREIPTLRETSGSCVLTTTPTCLLKGRHGGVPLRIFGRPSLNQKSEHQQNDGIRVFENRGFEVYYLI